MSTFWHWNLAKKVPRNYQYFLYLFDSKAPTVQKGVSWGRSGLFQTNKKESNLIKTLATLVALFLRRKFHLYKEGSWKLCHFSSESSVSAASSVRERFEYQVIKNGLLSLNILALNMIDITVRPKVSMPICIDLTFTNVTTHRIGLFTCFRWIFCFDDAIFELGAIRKSRGQNFGF